MNDADVDFILKRFDQTPAHLQRRIVASFVSQVADYKELTAELLAALKRCVAENVDTPGEVIQQAEAIIAKAEGRAS